MAISLESRNGSEVEDGLASCDSFVKCRVLTKCLGWQQNPVSRTFPVFKFSYILIVSLS